MAKKKATPTPPEVASGISPDAFSDTITVLYAIDGLAAKKVSLDRAGEIQVEGYRAGCWFHTRQYPVSSLTDLAVVLDQIQHYPKAFVIRGVPLESVDTNVKVRRTKDNFQTPKAGHHWVMIDFDSIQIPGELALRTNTAEVIEHVIQQLPSEFHHASYYWQLSAKAGFTQDNVISMHVWFWLSKPVQDKQLKDWACAHNTKINNKLIDPALFSDVQAHFTSAPILNDLDDPFPARSGIVKKAAATVEFVPTISPKRLSVPAHRSKPSTKIQTEYSDSFQHHLAQIGDHPGGAGFHRPIIQAAASYASTHSLDEIDREYLKTNLRNAILKADRSNHDDAYVEEMSGDAHLDNAIQSAIEKFSGPDRARRKPRIIEGIRPHFAAKPKTVDKAAESLAAELKQFFS